MAEKEKKKPRRTASNKKIMKQDQPLSGAVDPPKTDTAKKKGASQKTTKTSKASKTENKVKKTNKTNKTKENKTPPYTEGRFGEVRLPDGRLLDGRISASSRAPQAPKAPVEKTKKLREPKQRYIGSKPKLPVRVYFLGGLNEIGKNFTLYECGDDMVIVDCGLAFPDEEMFGVDMVIPDFAFVEKNREKIRGIVITHGHEDHIGAVPYLLKKLNAPVYGTALTIGLIDSKLQEHGLNGVARLNVTPAGSHIKLGCMDVEFIHVNHSIADAVALAIHTPGGVIVHTGDFKIDCTPAEGRMIDLARFAELGKEGVLALLADSTNAERPGYTQTEQRVNESLDDLFMRASGKRIIVATFASSISRVQMIINCAVKYGRKVALSGRSMVNTMSLASELGYLHVPDGVLIDLNLINRYVPEELVLITTGSQGEPMSALTRMAFSDHRQVAINQNDFIIISARPVPGNEKMVGTVVDELLKQGCTVIYESMYEVHVSGHACQEELKIIHGLTKPKYFIPLHGEQKHLQKHKSLAIAMGMPEKNVFIGNIGNVIELTDESMKQLADVPAGSVMVDGLGVGDVGSVVLRDRKHLAEDGLIVVVCALDPYSGHVVSGPDIVSRGFVYVKESEELMDEAKKIVYNTLEDCAGHFHRDWSGIKQSVKDELSRFLYSRTQRSPMILPIIMEV